MNPHPTCDAYPGQPEGANNFRCRLVVLSVDQLCPHPSYTRHQLSVSASQLTAISAFGDLAFQQPIMVTQKGIVIDGYARWELARQQGRESVLCLEFELGEEESLCWLVLSHRPSPGFNGYCRSLLALDLEPSLQEMGRNITCASDDFHSRYPKCVLRSVPRDAQNPQTSGGSLANGLAR
jgi:hypothetical protein